MIIDLIREEVQSIGPTCKVRLILDKMDKQDRKELTEALLDPAFTSAAISRALNRAGFDIRPDSISRHRRRDCTCERNA